MTLHPKRVLLGVALLTVASLSFYVFQFRALQANNDAQARQKLAILQSILQSRNDNDPRLDSEFRAMSPELKRTLRDYYKTLPAEELNARGTIAFLLGREARSSVDVQFLISIMNEAICKSLLNCAINVPAQIEMEMTLAYPQAVAIRMVQKVASQLDRREQQAYQAGLERLQHHNNSALALMATEALKDKP